MELTESKFPCHLLFSRKLLAHEWTVMHSCKSILCSLNLKRVYNVEKRKILFSANDSGPSYEFQFFSVQTTIFYGQISFNFIYLAIPAKKLKFHAKKLMENVHSCFMQIFHAIFSPSTFSVATAIECIW